MYLYHEFLNIPLSPIRKQEKKTDSEMIWEHDFFSHHLPSCTNHHSVTENKISFKSFLTVNNQT